MLRNEVRPVIYYYNPNIFPEEEYLIRKRECSRYAQSLGLEIIDGDYDHASWQCAIRGQEDAPERGARCLACFRMRLLSAARMCKQRGLLTFTTTLASSRWKRLDQISEAGHWAAQEVGGVHFDDRNWRKGGLQQRRTELIRINGFYNQVFCGCEYSLHARELQMQKAELRQWIRQLKAARSPQWRVETSLDLCRRLLDTTGWKEARTILLYHSLPDEVDTMLLLSEGVKQGKRVLLPRVVGDILELCSYQPSSLTSGAYGIMEPLGDIFPQDYYSEIDLAVVPGMAFTPDGVRMGRGKGYYDRLLPLLSDAYKVGLCFPFQLLDYIPSEPHDVLMDEILQ